MCVDIGLWFVDSWLVVCGQLACCVLTAGLLCVDVGLLCGQLACGVWTAGLWCLQLACGVFTLACSVFTLACCVLTLACCVLIAGLLFIDNSQWLVVC